MKRMFVYTLYNHVSPNKKAGSIISIGYSPLLQLVTLTRTSLYTNHPSKSPIIHQYSSPLNPIYDFFTTHVMNGRRISAVIFDLDGTLLDTERVTKDLLKEFLVRYGKVVDTEKENKRLGMIHHEACIAIVKDYDLPITPQQYSQSIMPLYHEKWLQAKPLPGVNRLIKHLQKHGIPFALASNSIRKNVEAKISSQKGWKELFKVILGSDQVKSGKPSPDLFLEAANKMGVDPSCCLVIEDSMVGVKAGKAANMQVVAIPSIQSESDEYSSIADVVIRSFLDFQPDIWGLPPFSDWVMKALPIEPIHFKGSYKNEQLSDPSNDIPGQLWGVFFGWVEKERLKIVVSIKWDKNYGSFTRNIQASFINGSNKQIYDEPMEVTLVGYIRGFHTKQNASTSTQILDQDKSIAEACLDLAAYCYQGCNHG